MKGKEKRRRNWVEEMGVEFIYRGEESEAGGKHSKKQIDR